MEEDEIDYISYGTPLPDLEDEFIQRKKAAKELEVRDEKGRQRFHGAFTGGFSAGYFNTVGTKEGWAPSTFVSSRDKTADRFQQNPEDFMDEEDLGEFGIASRRIQTTSKFTDSSDLKANKRRFTEVDSVIPGEAPLKDLVKPVVESIGIEILKKLGWKLGQGIGPRVKKDVGATKIYGCSPFPDNSIPEEDDPVALAYTFAPKDFEAQTYAPKDDVFGLGYTGLSKQSILGSHIDTSNPTFTKSWLKKDKKKITITGQAFGVGAFEDDDEDIYSKDDMSQYDFSDLESKRSLMSSKLESKQLGVNAVLEGFCLASEPPPIKKYYSPPNLPPDFRPIRSLVPKIALPAEPQFTSRHSMSAEGRSLLLGEKKFKSFQLSSDKKISEKKDVSPDKLNTPVFPTKKHSFRPFPNDQQKQERYEEYLKLKEAKEVEKLIQPSTMTEWEKQQEIEEFTRAAILFKPLSAALSSKFESKSHLSVEHEVMDAIAKSKKESEVSKTLVDKRNLIGLSKRTTSNWHPASLLCKRFNVPNPYPDSSDVSGIQKSKSLFDHISFDMRESSQNASVCAPSETRSMPSSPKAEPYKLPESTSNSNNMLTAIEFSNISTDVQEPASEIKRPPIDFFKDIFENSSSEDEESSQAEPPSKQSLDSSPKPTEKAEVTISSKLSTSTNDSQDLKPVKENKKVGFGVFANLDLDALNQRMPVVKTSALSDCEVVSSKNLQFETRDVNRLSMPFDNSSNRNTSLVNITISDNCGNSSAAISSNSLSNEMDIDITPPKPAPSLAPDLYGPELPPNYSGPSNLNAGNQENKKHTKHKMKHKHKHHKHKSKKRKKKKSSHKSSDDSSFGSDEDIPPTVILDKLKKLQKVMKSSH